MTRARRTTALLVGVPLAVVLLATAAWGVDAAVGSDGVARNTELAGTPVGGLSRPELSSAVREEARRFAGTRVEIRSDGATLTGTAGDLGLTVDATAATDAVWGVGRTDAAVARPARWARSLVSPTSVDLPLTLDRDRLAGALVRLEGPRRTAPVEPRLEVGDGGVRAVPGTDGRSLTVDAVARALPRTVSELAPTVRLDVPQEVVPPRTSDDAARRLAAQADKVTRGDITLSTPGDDVVLPGAELRTAFSLTPATADGREPTLAVDAAKVGELVAAHTATGANPAGVRFAIQGGTPVPVGGEDVVVCCGPEAPKLIATALLEGRTTVKVPTRTVTAAEARAAASRLGVKEVIGQFTTNHPAGQPRVTNIHRISDLTRGVLVPPGETFSVNRFVGRRTAANGFVSAPAISEGKFVEDIGGGVSQFATTLFNAAFFGGVDITAYKPHSIYISRYPFGREATLAYPGVDLRIRNNSKYGIVIWPTYTASSITVQLWSTKFATGEQTGQNKSSGCGRVVTERTRTFVDGRTATDRFYANYNCNPPKH